MTDMTPAETHQALAAAIERVAEVARAAKAHRDAMSPDDHFSITNNRWVLTDPASVLDRTRRDRARAERHRPAIEWGDPLLCHEHGDPWPCPDYRDLMLDYGIEVP